MRSYRYFVEFNTTPSRQKQPNFCWHRQKVNIWTKGSPLPLCCCIAHLPNEVPSSDSLRISYSLFHWFTHTSLVTQLFPVYETHSKVYDVKAFRILLSVSVLPISTLADDDSPDPFRRVGILSSSSVRIWRATDNEEDDDGQRDVARGEAAGAQPRVSVCWWSFAQRSTTTMHFANHGMQGWENMVNSRVVSE